MKIEQVVFYIFSLLAILSASMVIFSKNSVKSALFLILTFFATAGIWMLLEAEFLALTLILVYVGAVMVLFLFVIMMLDVDIASLREGFTRYLPFGLGVAALLIIGLAYAVGGEKFGLNVITPLSIQPKVASNIVALGTVLFTRFLYPFELAGVLLLTAIVAAISLTFRSRSQRIAFIASKQIETRKEDRIKLVQFEIGKKNL